MLKAALCLALALAAADVTGTWNFTVETDQGSGNPTFVLKQEGEKLTGTYTGLLGKADVTGSVKDNTIEIRFTVDAGGQSIAVVYTGTIESATRMKGKAQFGDLGSGTWTAVKKGTA